MAARARKAVTPPPPLTVLLAKTGIECTIELGRFVTKIGQQHEVSRARSYSRAGQSDNYNNN